jgi:hypothetical protein
MMDKNGKKPRKVLLAEFNEITWRLVDPLLSRGKLPALAQLIAQGTRGTPIADEVPPNLDPWISWTTVYTGRPQSEHGVHFLEQPPETVTGPRLWEIAADAGKSLGLFGSIMSWPPRDNVRGFWVPGTFSPAPDTFPPELKPIQDLNLSHTRAHNPLEKQPGLRGALGRMLRLKKLGLKWSTMAKALGFLVKTRLRPHRKWEKVSLQPLVNLDFFEALYHQYQPDFATFHTNHIAHYQHRYWKSMDPSAFPTPPSADEVRRFGPAIEHGYRVGDQVLQRMRRLADDNTVIIVASGLGQQPYIADEFKEGRSIIRLRSIQQIVRLCGLEGHCETFSVMAPQWNLKVPDPTRRAAAVKILEGSWYRTPEVNLFALDTVGDTICFNVSQKNLNRQLDQTAPCVIPGADGFRCTLGELCAVEDETPKEGWHERAGVVVMQGPGIRRGGQLADCTNLDLAPTMLHLLGLPIPSYMKGRVLEEAFEGAAKVSVPPSVLLHSRTDLTSKSAAFNSPAAEPEMTAASVP